MVDDEVLIKVWGGEFGLPSLDYNCLTVITYCKFSGAPINVVPSGYPIFTHTGTFPVFRHKNIQLSDVREIFRYLSQVNSGCDVMVSTRDNSDILAFTAMIEEKLLPAVLQVWWGDEKNFVDITRPFYAKLCRFPLNLWYPGSMQQSAKNRIQTCVNGERSNLELENIIYKEAKICLDRLSQKLGENNYFFGKNPSSLDATLFGHIGPLLKLSLNNNEFINHLRGCDNLCKLVARITQAYFPTPVTITEAPHSEDDSSNASTPDTDFPHKKRNMFLAALFALAANIVFVLASGIVQISTDDSNIDESNVTTSDTQFDHVYSNDDEDT